MRLFLSSYRAGNYLDRLVELFGKGSKVGVITNAKDYKNQLERRDSVEEVLNFFTTNGFSPVEVDLRRYFSKENLHTGHLCKFDALWLAGGNTFILRRALKYSGADRFIGDTVRKNEIILGGESAGAIIVSPTLKGAEDADDPSLIPEGYKNEVLWEGLNLISYVLVPHYGTIDFKEELDKYIKFLKNNSIPYKTLTDNQAIIIDGGKAEFLK